MGILHLGCSYLLEEEAATKLCADIQIYHNNGTREAFTLWYQVPKDARDYLTIERMDCFVVALLPHAMKHTLDIKWEGMLSTRLLHAVRQYFVPAMAAHTKRYHLVQLDGAHTSEPLDCKHAVGTGWSGGVDCFYTLMTHLHPEESSYQLTHLVVANAGAFEGEDARSRFQRACVLAQQEAERHHLSMLAIDTNLHEILEEHYLSVLTYRLPSTILAVQKLFGVYYNSSAYEFARFSIAEENSAYYELLPLGCFETEQLHFYSAGGAISRIQKLSALSEYKPATQLLHTCNHEGTSNCGHCGKCVRTIIALYALGKLDAFADVFDVKSIYDTIDYYVGDALYHQKSQHYGEALALMNKKGMYPSNKAMHYAKIFKVAEKSAKVHQQQLVLK